MYRLDDARSLRENFTPAGSDSPRYLASNDGSFYRAQIRFVVLRIDLHYNYMVVRVLSLGLETLTLTLSSSELKTTSSGNIVSSLCRCGLR